MSEDTLKFDTCRFRSAEEEDVVIPSCCGGTKIEKQYVCYELTLKDLNSEVCRMCDFYEPKSENV